MVFCILDDHAHKLLAYIVIGVGCSEAIVWSAPFETEAMKLLLCAVFVALVSIVHCRGLPSGEHRPGLVDSVDR